MSTRISAQEIEVSDGFIIDQWDIEDGLPANSVADILQSENGYLWLATFNGLVRFDGLRIKTFQTDSYSSMPSNRFNQILEANDGTLWLKTEQRYLVRFQDELFERIDFEKGLGNDFVNYLHKDKSGVLWFSTDSGITRYDGNSIELFHPELIDFGVGWVFPLENGELWFLDQSNQKVFRFSKNSL
ncbi:MAG: ligand-binding sensor domain-containing protein, partial [Balneolaceae bacterium]